MSLPHGGTRPDGRLRGVCVLLGEPTLATTFLQAARVIAALTLAGVLHGEAVGQVVRDSARTPPGPVMPLAPIEVNVSIVPLLAPAPGSPVPARVDEITSDELHAWHPRLATDALARRAGLTLYDDLGSAFKRTLVSRGFTSSPVVGVPQGLSVFLDGVPVNEPDARQVNFDLLPLEHVSRIEVLGGTASVLGPNSLGGAVNLITQSGGGPARADVSLTAGSFGTYAGEASWQGEMDGWRWYAGGAHETEKGWRQVTTAERSDALVNVSRGGETRGIRVQALGGRAYAETAGSLPESVYGVHPEVNLTAGDFEDVRQLHLAVSAYAPLGAGRTSASLYLRGNDAERFNVNQASDPDVRSLSNNRTLGASADWRWVREEGEGGLGVRLGASGTLNRTNVRIFAERLQPGMTTHVESPISEAGLFGTAAWTRGRLTASAAVRVDAVRTPFENHLNRARDTTSTYVQSSPRGGLSFEFAPGGSVYASVGRSFRAPAVIELACADPENPCPLPFALGDDPPLDPVTAVTYELGGRWLRGALELSAAAYLTNVENEIFLFPYSDEDEPSGSTIDGYFDNIAATRRLGAEVDASVDLPGGHTAFVGWTFGDATFQVDDIELFSIREEENAGENEIEEGDRLPLVPDFTINGGADVQLPAGLSAGLVARWIGERWLRGDEANEEEPLEPYFVADASVRWSAGGWGIQAQVENVFGSEYATFGTFNVLQQTGRLERFLTPGQPRSVRVTLERRFGR